MAENAMTDLLVERLVAADLPDDARNVVLAALGGEDALAAVVGEPGRAGDGADGSGGRDRCPPASPGEAGSVASDGDVVFLKSITVEGFRGVGPRRTLHLPMGAGLTVVVGRNGTGKSSFAEAVELALTGDNARWANRNKVWQDGWRNLHHSGPCAIEVELARGSQGTIRVGRHWSDDARLDDARVVGELDWGDTLDAYRPFLPYSELGQMVTGKPSELYDSVQRILGLDALVDVERLLKRERKRANDLITEERERRIELVRRLRGAGDGRADELASLLDRSVPDLDAASAIVSGSVGGEPAELRRLQSLSRIVVPPEPVLQSATERVRSAAERVQAMAGTDAAAARTTIHLLKTALAQHTAHGDGPCPVCGEGRLNDDWRKTARDHVESLTVTASEAEKADADLVAARAELDALTGEIEAIGATVQAALGDTGAASDQPLVELDTQLRRWREPAPGDLIAVVAHLERVHPALLAAAEAVRQRANDALASLDAAWRPLAEQAASHLEHARRARAAGPGLTAVKQAIGWIVNEGKDLRNRRLGPFAAESNAIWNTLRRQSSVDLGPIQMRGTGNRRELSIELVLDGVDGASLGVMSQGEIHALGLALFLPRATYAGSPFRFVVIDDPVQAMDRAKVDGLAEVLSRLANDRQIVVFTHDDRLPEALRRLQLPASVVEVVRRERSVVELREVWAPAAVYITDARAMASTDEVPAALRATVVAGLCRSAIEATCDAVIRRRRLSRGDPHTSVEAAIEAASSLYRRVALGLFDDADSDRQVRRELRKGGPQMVEVFNACKSGAHPGDGRPVPDPHVLVTEAKRLVDWLSERP